MRGYTCYNLYAFNELELDVVYLMQRKSSSQHMLSKMITACGAPTESISDNAPEFKSKACIQYLDKLFIAHEYTKPKHYPNQDLSERRGSAIKAVALHLLRVTNAPLIYWCFCLEYVALTRIILVQKQLN